ncbi:hypothetical protein Dsin_017333 [Dipteronia sinensis]|uniref:Uncharacterized protein n=1 Tax=Dipteronia sinensis TaxID=43782 RepID=A0AAE0AG52_9ROSI|nr:hypothetical protein Dsin_017333 [Dipteronia sinensis]
MSSLVDPKADLFNQTNQPEVVMRERRYFALRDYYHQIIPIHDHKEISASEFRQSCEYSRRQTMIELFLGDENTGKVLTPQDFIDYVQIFFRLNEEGELIVYGIRATTMDQFARIGLFRLLKRRDYSGREEEIIA